MSVAPSIPPDAPRVADGRYVLLTRLGEGGMAVVYGAWDEDLRIWRAVKVLLPEFARRSSVRRRFEREARTMMSIKHENLVRVIEVDARRALPYLVMDLIPGGSLEEWGVRHGPMPPALAVDVTVQIAQGLCAVHNAGVVHRDVKPQNVLVDPNGLCKLTDFGVARVAGGDTKTGVAVGTIGFMAPEQLADAKSADPRSDIFSLGATLFVLLTRAPARDLFRVVEDPTSLQRLPGPLQKIVGDCLRYERQERPERVDVVIDALLAARAALPPPPLTTPPLARIAAVEHPGVIADSFTELLGMLDTVLPAESTVDIPISASPRPQPARPESLAATIIQSAPARAPAQPRRPGLHPLAIPVALVLLALATLGTAALSASLAVGYGSAQVDAAADRCARAAAVAESKVADRSEIARDLSLVGVASEELPPEDRVLAEAIADVMRPILALPPGSDEPRTMARQRLQLVVWAVDDLHEAEAAWVEAAKSPLGQLAIWIGASSAPPAPPEEP